MHWDSERCAHSAHCVRGNPAVFNLRRRPWVDVNADDAESIVASVRNCPSGALSYLWMDGREPPEHYDGVEVTQTRGGPLYVRGDLHLVDRNGEVVQTGPRTALCGCGQSGNAPLCDGTHRRLPRQSPD